MTDDQRSATLARIQAMADEAAADTQLRKDAALWRLFAKLNPDTAASLAGKWSDALAVAE